MKKLSSIIEQHEAFKKLYLDDQVIAFNVEHIHLDSKYFLDVFGDQQYIVDKERHAPSFVYLEFSNSTNKFITIIRPEEWEDYNNEKDN